MGEGEKTFLDLVRALTNKRPLESIGSEICFKRNGKVLRMPRREFINLNNLRQLPYHHVDVKPYIEAGAKVQVRG